MIRSFLYKSFKYWNTIRYLKIVQIIGQIKKHLKLNFIKKNKYYDTNLLLGNWTPPIPKKPTMLGEKNFFFLNEYHEIRKKEDWNSKYLPKLWIYNLHYFDDLNAFDAFKRVSWHRKLIQRWIEQNPIFHGVGWEPYPSSLRIINWIKWALNGNTLEENWIFSLVLQVRHLKNNLEKHLLGNHLFANATALIFAGLFFKGKEAMTWYKTGYKIVKNELPEQVLPDGANFELSTMYHSIFFENLLDIINIHNVYKKKVPEGIFENLNSMFFWIEKMCHPDGRISFFNDSAFGVSPEINELKEYGKRLSLKEIFYYNDGEKRLIHFKDSGYSRVEIGEAIALIDRAPIGPDHLPGHAHADTFSFELSLFKKRVIVNSGTSIYENNPERAYQRSTAAHSTLVIDKENSSEVWSSFRVARRARVFDIKNKEEGEIIEISAGHNGYKRLRGKPIHFRRWKFSNNTMILEDRIVGNGKHLLEAIFPLHPEVRLINIFKNNATLEVSGMPIVISIDGDGKLDAIKSKFNPEFGLSVENKKLVYILEESLPVIINTKIKW